MADVQKFLMFIDAADDAATYPAANLLAMTCASNGVLELQFKSSIGGRTGAEHDSVHLTITADTEKAVMSKIARSIHATGPGYNDGLIVVADDVNSIYLDSNITACDINLDT
jgi:hypothetical protein